MPTAALKPCSGSPTCPQRTVHGGPCPVHARAVQRRRGSQRARGYTRRWERARVAFLADHPLCGMRSGGQVPVFSQCCDAGRVTPATVVDHVTPHAGDDGRFWDLANWQALCASCHARKTLAGL